MRPQQEWIHCHDEHCGTTTEQEPPQNNESDLGEVLHTDIENDTNLQHITPDTLMEAFKTFGNNKAAGPDKITPDMLKHLPMNIIIELSNIMKASVGLAYTPKQW